MPFSLHGAAASFQGVMDKALKGMQDHAVAYIDDILIYNPLWEAQMDHIRKVLDDLWQTGPTVNLKTSKLGQSTVQYLGFHIGHGKISDWSRKGSGPPGCTTPHHHHQKGPEAFWV